MSALAGRGVARRVVVAGTACACLGLGAATLAGTGSEPPEVQVVARATALLPVPLDVPVVPIDPELSADPAALRGLDAFIVRERDGRLRQVIYVNARAEIVRRAARGSRLFLAVLASVLHHEHQHLLGADELRARRAERQMFEALMARGAVDAREGARYLEALKRQPTSTTAEHAASHR